LVPPQYFRAERPTDLDFVPFLIVPVKAGRPDDPSELRFDSHERPSRLDAFVEERSEHGLLESVPDGMLFPDEGVGCHSVECIEIVGLERTEVQERSPDHGLQIERHSSTRRALPG
jgi:hypothetical protein